MSVIPRAHVSAEGETPPVLLREAGVAQVRKVVIFEPYPSVVDPNDPQMLAFNPRVSNHPCAAPVSCNNNGSPHIQTQSYMHFDSARLHIGRPYSFTTPVELPLGQGRAGMG